MISIDDTAEGAVVAVRVLPRARKNEVLGEREGSLLVAVSAVPEDGKANQAVEKLLAKQLDLPRSCVSILAGSKSRNKRVLLRGMSETRLREWLNSSERQR